MVAAITSISIHGLRARPRGVRGPVTAETGWCSAQHLATMVGVDVLNAAATGRRGGSVGYALAVVYPAAGNLGAVDSMTIQLADGRKTFLDFRETCAQGRTANMYLDKDGNASRACPQRAPRRRRAPQRSGMEYAREKYGTMKRADLIAPPSNWRDGFALDQGDVDMLLTATKISRRILRQPPSSSTTASRSR